MTKRDKRIKKLFTSPKTVTFKELEKVLFDSGFMKKPSKSGSSHFGYKRQGKVITIPYRKPYVKEVYVKLVLDLIGEEL